MTYINITSHHPCKKPMAPSLITERARMAMVMPANQYVISLPL